MPRTRNDRPGRGGGNARRITLAVSILTLLTAACTDQPLATGPAPAAGPRPTPRTPNATIVADRRVSAIQVSVADLPHACALETDGAIVCWGSGYDNPYEIFRGDFTWVAAGGFADCGILAGALYCFRGLTTPPTGTFTRVSLGVDHGCAIRTDETIACWGSDEFGKATPPTGTFLAVDAGAEHTCGIRTDNTHECWGNPAHSDLDPDFDNTVPDWTGTYLRVSAGGSHTCAIKSNGAVLCGGVNTSNQVSGGMISDAIDVSAGTFHTCGVSSLLNVHCWGLNDVGQTEPPSGQYTRVAAARSFTCAITTLGNVRCWGSRNFGIQVTPYEISDTQATETTLDITPRPGTFGAEVEMTARVSVPARVALEGDDAEKPTTGRVMFIDGGTCEEPTTVLAAGEPIVVGRAVFTTTALAVGTHSIGACYLGGDGLLPSGIGASLEITAAPTTTTVAPLPLAQQYSDRVTLQATVSPASVNGIAAAGLVQFTIDGALVGGGPVAVAANGTATLPNVQMTMAPGPHSVGARFTPTDQTLFMASTATTASLTVTREDASIVYPADNPTALQVSTPGGTLAANALSLELGVRETEPDAANAPGTTGIGTNIGGVGLAVSLLPIGPGSTYALTCTATGVTGTGYATTRNFTCTNPAGLPVNVYAVQATVTSDYYQVAQYDDVLTVYDPVAGFATGGGTFRIDGDLVRFGISMKYKTNGKGANAVQGSVFAVRHHANGRKSRMESNALSSAAAIGEDPTVPMGWAVLSGKATYTTWDAATSSNVTTGGQSFTLYVEDRGEPGSGTDRVWMGGPGVLTLPGTLSTAAANAVTLTGGNLSVPHRAP